MSLRNKGAALLGLQHYSKSELENIRSSIHKNPYIVGERAGMFSVISVSEDEVILGDDDKHLNFRVSVLVLPGEESTVYVSTIVDEHNLMGRIYMLIVRPVHRIIAPCLVRKAKIDGRL